MPFDNTPFIDEVIEEDHLQRGPEGLAQMARMLRRAPPENFSWDFGIQLFVDELSSPCKSNGCAIGWAIVKWPSLENLWKRNVEWPGCDHDAMAEYFDVPPIVIESFFFDYATKGVKRFSEVTPSMVADQIDNYLRDGYISDL